jgi:hypothetical protein
MNWIEACDKAREIVSAGDGMDQLYRRALRYYGEGELRTSILSLASEAIEDESLREEVFAEEEGLLSLFCGMWIHFLLTEIAGLKGEDLRTLALRVFKDFQSRYALH